MSGIMEINRDTFWTLLEQAKKECGQNLCEEYQWLEEKLMSMVPEQALRFQYFTRGYRDAAYKYGLWSAACVLSHGCSEDDFIDFRAWLIAQGKEVYLTALKDPDSLAAVEPYDGCRFENLSYLGDWIYEEKTGNSAYDVAVPQGLQAELEQARNEIVYSPDIEYPLEWHELESYLPRLFKKYLTPEQIRENIARGVAMWNQNTLELQMMREKYKPQKANSSRKKGDDAR